MTNAGTISGGIYAIDFAGSATNRLVVDPGAVFVGRVIGGNGTLELASGTGSIGGVGTGSFNNFQVVAVDAGANWTLNGANLAPTILDNGTVSITGSLDVSTAIDASSTGLFQLGSGATFEVAAATGTATKINFQGSSSELIIDDAASFGTHVGTASYAGPQLQHFVPGDKIDLKNFSSAGVTLTYNASTGVLQVSNGASQVASLRLPDLQPRRQRGFRCHQRRSDRHLHNRGRFSHHGDRGVGLHELGSGRKQLLPQSCCRRDRTGAEI